MSSPTPSMPMLCSTYETMCPQCRFHYIKLREKGVLPGHLNYHPGTYPVIFTCNINLDLCLNSHNTHINHGLTALSTIRSRLESHFKLPVPVHSHRTSSVVGSKIHVHQSLLFDFPFKLKALEQWKSWLADFVNISVYEKSDTLKPRAHYTTGPEDWNILCPDEEEERHLCWKRMRWFLEREGVGVFVYHSPSYM
ncbi:hypothetical protein BDW67DRAFT_175397 [Aspergillus spinulosporus]